MVLVLLPFLEWGQFRFWANKKGSDFSRLRTATYTQYGGRKSDDVDDPLLVGGYRELLGMEPLAR